MGRACLMWVYQCESPFVMSESDSNIPLMQLKTASIFHSTDPRQRRRFSPSSVSWERLAAAGPHFGHITFTYWTLLDSPRRGERGKGDEGSCGVCDAHTQTKKFIYPHMPHCGVCYGVTTGRGHNLDHNNTTLAFICCCISSCAAFLNKTIILKDIQEKW